MLFRSKIQSPENQTAVTRMVRGMLIVITGEKKFPAIVFPAMIHGEIVTARLQHILVEAGKISRGSSLERQRVKSQYPGQIQDARQIQTESLVLKRNAEKGRINDPVLQAAEVNKNSYTLNVIT